jgi:flavin-dependent dehydrogenase
MSTDRAHAPNPDEAPGARPELLPRHVDVAVIGAGTAGAAVTALCAQRGMRVLCIDRGALDRAGARWVNGVPAWAFAAAGLALPEGEELLGNGEPFHLIAGRGPLRLTIPSHGVLEVDMRLLVARLQGLARRGGAHLAGGVSVRGVDGVTHATSHGDVRAEWIVDASGLTGARLLGQPRVAPRDLCAAAQEVREVRDRAGAEAFFARHDVPLGEIACFTGIAGGYSILNLRCDGDRVGLLTGSVTADGHVSGKAILDGCVAEEPWIGRLLFGGARAVPLRRPLDRLAQDRIALVGDAGCQVFPAHASGIGPGLLAARYLCDALAEGRGPVGYQVAWQRAIGGLYAAYDLFRRFSQTLTLADLERMITSGLLDPLVVEAGLAQKLPRPSLGLVVQKAAGLLRAPELARRLAAVGARMVAVQTLYARYPRDPAGLPRWSSWVARVMGDRPDIT